MFTRSSWRKPSCLIVVLLLATSAFAESVTLNNGEASRLFVALRALGPGISGTNIRNAAVDINALRPYVEAYDLGQTAIGQRAQKVPAADASRDDKLAALNLEAQKLMHAPITVSLTLFQLSDDELRDAKITADTLAELVRWLTPQPAKK